MPISALQFDRSEQTAIAITGIWAYTTGFEVFVTRLIRPDAPGFDGDPVPGAPRGMLAERQSFQISLQLSDGSKIIGGDETVTTIRQGRSCGRAAAAVVRTIWSCGGGHGRCHQAGRWSSSASSGPAKRGWASTHS